MLRKNSSGYNLRPMKLITRRHFIVLCCIAASLCRISRSQTGTSEAASPTFKVETRLVLVDVIAEYLKTDVHSRALLTELKLGDFRLFEDGKEVPIRSFDVGSAHATR